MRLTSSGAAGAVENATPLVEGEQFFDGVARRCIQRNRAMLAALGDVVADEQHGAGLAVVRQVVMVEPDQFTDAQAGVGAEPETWLIARPEGATQVDGRQQLAAALRRDDLHADTAFGQVARASGRQGDLLRAR